jgi:TPP-dependent pyruvate/acetoin dehydrogenase alpha subunit
MEPTKEHLLWMYEQMLIIRDFEETMVNVYLEGKLPPNIQEGLAFDIGGGPVPGEMHLAAGQEPVAVGTCAHLNDNDTITGTHRPHHFAIAKGIPLNALAAEMFGKVTGLGRGKGGHMHLFSVDKKFGCSGIIGAGMPQACGAALAAKKKGKDWVAVTFFGEGAANQGSFHESLNLAAVWKLPVVFICEDNKYAISVTREESTAIANNADRAAGYGVPGVRVENNDAVEVYDVVGEAIARARRGEGPSLIEVSTDRYLGHFQGDAEAYRPKDEVQKLRENDPIDRLKQQVMAAGVSEAEEAQVRARAKAAVEAAYTFARESPYPDVSEATQHVFV